MNSTIRTLTGLFAGALIVAGLAAGCGEDRPASPAGQVANAQPTTVTPAAALRSDLNRILAEHVTLAASTTSAALGGRNTEFAAAANALDANSVELSKAIGSVYGPEAEKAFLNGWRRHIGFFVEYTQGAAAKDQAKKDEALAGLAQYAQDLAKLLNGANGMPIDAVVQLVGTHAQGLTATIDAQAAGDQAKAFELMRASAAHMHAIADPLAEATVKKFPEKFKV